VKRRRSLAAVRCQIPIAQESGFRPTWAWAAPRPEAPFFGLSFARVADGGPVDGCWVRPARFHFDAFSAPSRGRAFFPNRFLWRPRNIPASIGRPQVQGKVKKIDSPKPAGPPQLFWRVPGTVIGGSWRLPRRGVVLFFGTPMSASSTCPQGGAPATPGAGRLEPRRTISTEHSGHLPSLVPNRRGPGTCTSISRASAKP